MTKAEIKVETPPSESRLAELHENLASAGQMLRDDELKTFLLSVSAADGNMAAGCKGEIAFRSAHVSALWVDENQRGQGLGSRLLASAEDYAREQGCDRIHLETRNESARRLYERLGYDVFGALPDYEGTNTLYYLTKNIG